MGSARNPHVLREHSGFCALAAPRCGALATNFCTGTERASAVVLTGLPAWLREGADGCVISVHAQPGAKHTAVAGLHGEALKIRLAAPPVDGKANAELLRFVAERLGVARSAITLLAGDASRAKRLRVVGASAAQIVARLGE